MGIDWRCYFLIAVIKKVFNTDADRRRTVTNLPIGSVMLWHSSTPPSSGWLICNGQESPIASYTALYNLITANGTVFPYGSNTNGFGAAGSTHFRLPDMRDRFIMSPTKTGTNPGSTYVASTGGSNTHTHDFITAATNHSLDPSYHAHTFNIGGVNNAGQHNHNDSVYEVGGFANYNNVNTNVLMAASGNVGAALNIHAHNVTYSVTDSGDHGHVSLYSNYSGAQWDQSTWTAHSHTATVTGQTQTPSPQSHVPQNLKVYYIVLAAT